MSLGSSLPTTPSPPQGLQCSHWLIVRWCFSSITSSKQRYSPFTLLTSLNPSFFFFSFFKFFPLRSLSHSPCPVVQFQPSIQTPALEEGAGFPLYARSLCAAAEESCTQTWWQDGLSFLHLYSSSGIGLWFFFSLYGIFLRLPHQSYTWLFVL